MGLVEGLDAFCGVDGDDVSKLAAGYDLLNFFVEVCVAEDEAEDDDPVVLFG